MIIIYIANLGKYNEGELVGKWVQLPCNDRKKELRSIGVSDEPDENGEYYEEYIILDYETDISGLKIGEYDSLDELNELAERLEDFDSSEKIAFRAFVKNGSSLEDALEGVENINYAIYWNCYDMEDVAIKVAKETGMLYGVPDIVARYFDYEAYGRDLDLEGTFIAVDNHYVEIW